jgi:hypothetical protein
MSTRGTELSERMRIREELRNKGLKEERKRNRDKLKKNKQRK